LGVAQGGCTTPEAAMTRDQIEPLTDIEIDELCERLNVCSPAVGVEHAP
jgi:hypothetical protein